jgi:protein-tyrosine-phosphatase/predicted ATP-grasp superfamily ATP-dependent carboligase
MTAADQLKKKETMPHPVLILGAERRIAVAIARSLAQHGIVVDAASLSMADPPLASRAVRRFFRLPPPVAAPDAFAEALIATVRRHAYDLIIPSSDSALIGLAQRHQRLVDALCAHGDHPVYLGYPGPVQARQVLDKTVTLQVARDCGLLVPVSHRIERIEDLDGIRTALRFPAIVKPATKSTSAMTKVRHCSCFDELQETLQEDPDLAAGALVQDYCPGQGVGIEVLMHEDEPVAMFQHRRLKEWPPSGGVSALAVSEAVDPSLGMAAVTLLRRLRWSGVAMVEFRQDAGTGRAVLMEVNGRYWGSLPLSRLAGLEMPYYEWQLTHGQRPAVPECYRTGVRWRWTRGLLLHARAEYREQRRIGRWAAMLTAMDAVKELIPPTRDGLWSMRDPSPAVREFSQTLRELTAEAIKAGCKRVLPSAVVELRRTYRLLGRRDGSVYLQRELLRLTKLQRDVWQPRRQAIRSVLFVCHGNIIRSPMAAALLARELTGATDPIAIASAGLHAKPYGAADPRARAVAAQFGCCLDSHESRMVSHEMVQAADAIFVMDRLNEAKLLGRFPEARSKLWLLGACHREGGLLDIADPYAGELEDVRRCFEQLARCVHRLAAGLGAAGHAEEMCRQGTSEPTVSLLHGTPGS